MRKIKVDNLSTLLKPPPHEIIGIDPGDTTGWFRYIDGKPQSFGQLKWRDELVEWLDGVAPDIFVVEDYYIVPAHLNRGFAHQWNPVIACRVIGAVEQVAYRGAEVHYQRSSVLDGAAKQTGMTYNKKKEKGKHHLDAALHIEHWLRKNSYVAGEGTLSGMAVNKD